MPVLLVWSDKTKQNQQDLKSGIVRGKKISFQVVQNFLYDKKIYKSNVLYGSIGSMFIKWKHLTLW